MNDLDSITLKAGTEPSERMTRAFVSVLKSEYPELWLRLKAREIDLEARADEYMMDPKGFVDSDPVMDEIRPILAHTFDQLNTLQLSLNISDMREIALVEAEMEARG